MILIEEAKDLDQVANKFFIPIDRKSIRYNNFKKGPYIVPIKVTYEQTNNVTTTGDKVEGGLVIGESKIHYLGPIKESKDYKEVYYGYPKQQYLYNYKNVLVQCQDCFGTFLLYDAPLHQFYDSEHDDYYDDGKSRKCFLCNSWGPLDLEFEELDRPTLEKYAAENTLVPPRID